MTRDIAGLVTELVQKQVKLCLRGGTIFVDAPKGLITDETLKVLRENKKEIVGLLEHREAREGAAREAFNKIAEFYLSGTQRGLDFHPIAKNKVDAAEEDLNLKWLSGSDGEFTAALEEYVSVWREAVNLVVQDVDIEPPPVECGPQPPPSTPAEALDSKTLNDLEGR